MVCEQSCQNYRVNQVQFTDPLSGSVRSLVGFFLGDNTMKYIPLTKGKYAIVDDDDYEYLMQWKWHVSQQGTAYYAARSRYSPEHTATISMHRFLMEAPSSKQVDHINHDGLDNQKKNLRLCSRNQNQQNRKSFTAGTTSKHKGVHLHRGKWQVSIKKNGKGVCLGAYVEEDDAGRAYDKKARELFGEFACFNFPETE